ncbi:MAG: PAS domain S-box protein [Gemmatimonadales bacterium]|nr:MAG: PAS domain S-box protein [Gemmatimonadales bacterium]
MDQITDRLREVRQRTGLGTRGFAHELEQRAGYQVSHSSVAQYESGTTVPAPYADAVARAFLVDPRWLLSGEGLPERNQPSEVERAFHVIARTVQRIRAAPSTVESQFDAFFRLSPDLLQIVTPEGYVVRVNPSTERITGFPPETMLTAPFFDFLDPDDRPAARRVFEGLSDGTSPVEFENRHRRREGGFVWISWVAAHSDGLVYLAGRDATERRETHRALRLERDFMEGVLAVADAVVVVTDQEGRIVRMNRKGEELTGLNGHDAVGRAFPEMLLPREERGVWAANHRQLLEGRGPVLWESTLLVPARPGIQIRWSFAGLRGEDNFVSHTVGIGTDVTAQRSMERELRANEETLRAVVESVTDGLFMMEQSGRISWTNQRMSEIFGYPPGGLTGEPLDLLLPEEVREAHRTLQEGYLLDPRPGMMSPGRWVRGRCKDGSEVEVEVLLSPMDPPELGVVGRVTLQKEEADST